MALAPCTHNPMVRAVVRVATSARSHCGPCTDEDGQRVVPYEFDIPHLAMQRPGQHSPASRLGSTHMQQFQVCSPVSQWGDAVHSFIREVSARSVRRANMHKSHRNTLTYRCCVQSVKRRLCTHMKQRSRARLATTSRAICLSEVVQRHCAVARVSLCTHRTMPARCHSHRCQSRQGT